LSLQSLKSLRAFGDSVLGTTAKWDTIVLPRSDRIKASVEGMNFRVAPVLPEERSGLFGRGSRPTLWMWEVEPEKPGELRLSIGGDGRPDAVPKAPSAAGIMAAESESYVFISRKVIVEKTFAGRVSEFFDTAPARFLGFAGFVGLLKPWARGVMAGWDWWRRRRRRPAGYGR